MSSSSSSPSAALSAHIATSESCASIAASEYRSAAALTCWSDQNGQQFLIRAVDSTLTNYPYLSSLTNWPTVYDGSTALPVKAAVWRVEDQPTAAAAAASSSSSTVLLVGVWSLCGSSTFYYYLPDYADSMRELSLIVGKGRLFEKKLSLLGSKDYFDAFNCGSSHGRSIQTFYCPSLEKMTLGEIRGEGTSRPPAPAAVNRSHGTHLFAYRPPSTSVPPSPLSFILSSSSAHVPAATAATATAAAAAAASSAGPIAVPASPSALVTAASSSASNAAAAPSSSSSAASSSALVAAAAASSSHLAAPSSTSKVTPGPVAPASLSRSVISSSVQPNASTQLLVLPSIPSIASAAASTSSVTPIAAAAATPSNATASLPSASKAGPAAASSAVLLLPPVASLEKYPAELFVALDEEYVCGCCTEVPFEPPNLPCGHLFCRSCLVDWSRKGKMTCPACRDSFTQADIITVTAAVRRQIAGMKVHCRSHEYGCKVEIMIGVNRRGLEEHESQQCEYAAVECRECKKMIQRRHIEVHNASECSERLLNCPSCSESFRPKDLAQHRYNGGHYNIGTFRMSYPPCRKFVRCPFGCDEGEYHGHFLGGGEMEKHMVVCREVLIMCDGSVCTVGKSHEIKRHGYKAHVSLDVLLRQANMTTSGAEAAKRNQINASSSSSSSVSPNNNSRKRTLDQEQETKENEESKDDPERKRTKLDDETLRIQL